MNYRVGDWVEIRSKDEILSTLDENGRLDGLPFMPQMFQWCGQRFQIYKRAHKTCDTVNKTGGRRLVDCVHIELRCDGQPYGGCEAACLLFWKTAWIKPLASPPGERGVMPRSRCTESDVLRATRLEQPGATGEIRYQCQATQLPEYTTLLRWWDVRQYIEDVRSGNSTIGFILGGFIYFSYRFFIRHSFWRLSVLLQQIYDRWQAVRGGVPYPRRIGTVPAGELTPMCSLELHPGDLVRVKSHNDILATLNENNKNRGLFFDAELVPYCGGVYKIKARIDRFLDERTGEMITLKRGAFMLEGVWCRSQYSECRLACPRSIHSWWREIWLEKIETAESFGKPEEYGDSGE